MKLSDHQWEFLQDVASLVKFAAHHGYKLTGGELYRPQEMQQIYFDAGKSKTLNSYHGKKCAQDLNCFKDGKYLTKTEDIKLLGDYWKSLNPLNKWGGDWGWDANHFERAV